jgi:alkanesulfonate monooxygenase SsuD/methylene tetrahydromethanopterin reductase-like flavin-dependent oxidoreductase (luciferase family)
MEWVAKQRYTYMVLPTLAPFELRRQSAEYFRECCVKAGYTTRHEQIGWGIGVYVAETDAEARREYEPHFWYYARNLLRTPAQLSLPPGHSSLATMVGMAERRLRSRPGALSTWKEVERGGYVVVGSPETVRQRLEEYAQRVGFGVLVANFSVGNAPSELTRRSMTLFAQEVMPRLKHLNADPLLNQAEGAHQR